MFRIPILYRYIIREILSPFLLTLFVFTGVLFLIRSITLVDMVINKDVPALDIILLFSYIVPRFLEIALPMSLLLGIIIAFSRLSADSELVVIRATGISIKRLALPVFIFAVAATFFTLFTSMWFRPWATHRLGVGMFEIAKTKASSGLVPGIFNELGNITIYAREINQDTKRLNSIIISDRQDEANPRSFIAKNGHIISDPRTRTITLRLYDGVIQEGTGLNLHFTNFEVNDINLSEGTLFEDGSMREGKKPVEMYFGELGRAIELGKQNMEPTPKQVTELLRYLAEYHSRLAIPLSCLCIAFVAMALGVQPSRGGKQWGLTANIIVGIIVIFVYYILMAIADAMSQQGRFPVWALVWTPNLLFLLFAIFLFRQIGSERWLAVSEAVSAAIATMLYSLRVFDRSREQVTE